ncbi:MAG TPA: class I SAM-dependent methyltransferase [Steroidobacteraceae bacterium]
MSFKDHFSRLAAQYCAFRPSYPASLFEYLAQVCAARRFAWDCACGSGQATVGLVPHFAAVLGTDASTQQLSRAPPHPHVSYRVAPAEASGVPPDSVDLVVVAQALHWLPLERFYREVERVLHASGVLAVWSYGSLHVEGDGIDTLLQHFYHDIVGPYWPAERRLVEAGYRALPFPFAPLEPPAFQMREQWPLAHLLGYLRTWSATGRYVEVSGTDPVIALENRVAPVWGPPETARRVTWPLSLRVGRKC